MNSLPEPKVAITGVVEMGGQFARTLGYPTVNVSFRQQALSGTYSGLVLYNGISYPAGLYIDPERAIVEAHLFDFEGDLYGHTVTVHVFEKIRPKEHFDTLDDLKGAIHGDMEMVKKWYTNFDIK